MRSRVQTCLAALVAGALLAGCGSEEGQKPQQRPSVAPLVRALDPSIVSIEAETPDAYLYGTGVVWSRDGLVVTAHHAVEDADRVTVYDAEGVESAAAVVASDESLDLALLQLPRTDLEPARFATGLPRVGALAVTVGRPPPKRILRSETGRIRALHAAAFRTRGMDDLLQSDADVRHGDSGGALAGRGPVVYGIVLASDLEGGIDPDEPSDRTYAIAAPLVREFVERVLRGDAGEPGFLGLDAANITPDLRDRHDLDASSGVVVLTVQPDTPADRAGLRYRDVFVSIDGAPVERLSDLDAILRTRPPGSQISIVYLRDGRRHTATTTLAPRPTD